jgi:sortase family protein
VRILGSALRHRLLPAVLAATGVSLIAGGLLTYTGAAGMGPPPDETPIVVAGSPTPTPSLLPPTLPASSASPSIAPSASPGVDRVATRVVVRALKIDMPVIKPRGGPTAYPQCDVAMYLLDAGGYLKQPGQGSAIYLYAHARDGMFGPIYRLAIEKKTPNKMKGMLVEVYTSDDQVFWYEISEVRLHQTSLDDAVEATSEELWLQTSEGPKGTPGKTQVRALPIAVLPANHADAHPKARPVNCG